MQTPTRPEPGNEDKTTLTDASGIGDKTAQNLMDKFGKANIALDAAVTIPNWLTENIDGIGEKNVQALADHADTLGHKRASAITQNQTKQGFKIYEKRYYPVGETTDRIRWYYTGYFQGGSYGTAITRQTWSRDRVNRVMPTFYSMTEREPIKLQSTPSRLGKGKETFRDFIENREWESVTRLGMIWYTDSLKLKPEDMPEQMPGYQKRLEPVGITTDRILVYMTEGSGGSRPKAPAVRKFVKDPKTGEWEAIHGRGNVSCHGSDKDFDPGKYADRAQVIKGMAEEGIWKEYAGDLYLRDEFQQHV